ncbi:MAG: hypothetical protein LBF40_04860 [Deltaproteobacteria bacterium]|nr:hypothetical protein [Deltaproteobacteria bacterium]
MEATAGAAAETPIGATAEAPGDAVDTPPVLSLAGVRILDENGLGYGPLDLSLGKDERALVQAENPSVIAGIIRVALAMRKPHQGSVGFEGRGMDAGKGVLERSALYARIGIVCELFGLLPGVSPLNNLMAYSLYHLGDPKKDLEARCVRILKGLGFGEAPMRVPCSELNKPYRTLGLVGLAIAKEPPLVIIERPKRFLGRLFPKAWGFLTEECGKGGGSILVLALKGEDYGDLDFHQRVRMGR